MPADPIAIGSRRELLLDDHLIDRLDGAELRLQQPVPREIVLETDRPWEGNMNTFNTLLLIDGVWHLYYRGWQVHVTSEKDPAANWGLVTEHAATVCVATSADGRHFTRPELGLYDFNGSRANNIIWMGEGWHGFSPFRDTNPACAADAPYKAIGVKDDGPKAEHGLWLFASADGIHWRRQDAPILLGVSEFDSHNTLLWDRDAAAYRLYARVNRKDGGIRIRDIFTMTSPDLVTWSEPTVLQYPGMPNEELYTNNIMPYPRAPHLRIGLPARYVSRPEWNPTIASMPEPEHRRRRYDAHKRYGTAVTDTVFMSSRDAVTFRRWGEALIRPGLRQDSWTYGDIYTAWGLVETASDLPGGVPELSLYASEGYWRGSSSGVRRYTLRLDGFVALHAPFAGGSMLSKPLSFTGSRLSLNVSTSAAGWVRVGLIDPHGADIPGYTAADCYDIVGDTLDYTVTWRDGADVSSLAGRPVCLQIEMRDADLYALQFC